MVSGTCTPNARCVVGEGGYAKAKNMKAFTLVEMLLVVILIAGLLAIGTAAYRRAKWTTKVTAAAIENRQRLNQAVADQKFKTQKRFNEELDRLKRQADIGLKQGK